MKSTGNFPLIKNRLLAKEAALDMPFFLPPPLDCKLSAGRDCVLSYLCMAHSL